MNEDKELSRISKIIRALLAKTEENGCTESEAMEAALKAQELLEKHQLKLSDLELREEGTERIKVPQDHIKRAIYYNVGKFCECKSWHQWVTVEIPAKRKNSRSRFEQREEYNFIGLKGDAFFAEWLLVSLARWIANKKMVFMFEGLEMPNAYQIASWEQGITDRINERLREEINKRNAMRMAQFGTGRDLVPLKNAMIKEAFEKTGIRLVKSSSNRINADPNSYTKGAAEGNNARFNRPVNNQYGGTRLLK